MKLTFWLNIKWEVVKNINHERILDGVFDFGHDQLKLKSMFLSTNVFRMHAQLDSCNFLFYPLSASIQLETKCRVVNWLLQGVFNFFTSAWRANKSATIPSEVTNLTDDTIAVAGLLRTRKTRIVLRSRFRWQAYKCMLLQRSNQFLCQI